MSVPKQDRRLKLPPEITHTWNFSNNCPNNSAILSGNGDLLGANVPSRSNAINFFIGLIPLTLVLLISHQTPTWKFPLVRLVVFSMTLFSTGLSLLLSITYINFDDSRSLINILLLVLQYMTPVFYSLSALGPNTQRVISKNPLTSFLNVLRENWGNTYNGTIHDWIYLASFSSVVFIAGSYLFAKWWPKGVTKL